jgi:hypothetical protein
MWTDRLKIKRSLTLLWLALAAALLLAGRLTPTFSAALPVAEGPVMESAAPAAYAMGGAGQAGKEAG